MNKKTLLPALLAMIIPAISAMDGGQLAAQDITSTFVGVASVVADGEDCPFYGTFRVSDNGEYAVASDSETSYAGLLWTRSTNEIQYVNDFTGSKYDGVILCDVANDGRMVGAYPGYQTNATTGVQFQCWTPAYKYINGQWVDLPLPANTCLSYPMDLDYCTFAKRISPNGRLILGEAYLITDSLLSSGSYKKFWEPILWVLDESGAVTETRTFENLPYGGQGFIPYDMTDDGSVIVGMAENVRGEQLPAMIKDNELVFLAAPVLTMLTTTVDDTDYYYYREYDADGNEQEYFWDGGIVNCIDDDMNIYYYYTDGANQFYSYVENIATGEKTQYPSYVACGTGGVVLGLSTVFATGKDFSLDELYTALNIADDGTVIAGGGLGEAYSENYNFPALVTLSESPLAAGIKTPTTMRTVTHSGTYNLLGQPIHSTSQRGVHISNGKKYIAK